MSQLIVRTVTSNSEISRTPPKLISTPRRRPHQTQGPSPLLDLNPLPSPSKHTTFRHSPFRSINPFLLVSLFHRVSGRPVDTLYDRSTPIIDPCIPLCKYDSIYQPDLGQKFSLNFIIFLKTTKRLNWYPMSHSVSLLSLPLDTSVRPSGTGTTSDNGLPPRTL